MRTPLRDADMHGHVDRGGRGRRGRRHGSRVRHPRVDRTAVCRRDGRVRRAGIGRRGRRGRGRVWDVGVGHGRVRDPGVRGRGRRRIRDVRVRRAGVGRGRGLRIRLGRRVADRGVDLQGRVVLRRCVVLRL